MATITDVRQPGIFIGRIAGVELRLRPVFLFLLPVLMLYSSLLGARAGRGAVLWLLLLAAVGVRETARGIAGAALGASPERLELLMTGALPERSGPRRRRGELLLALIGPIANCVTGLTLGMLATSAVPGVDLFHHPYIDPRQLLRSAMWSQVLLGVLHLAPAWPLDAGVLLRREVVRLHPRTGGQRNSARASQLFAWLLMAGGAVGQNAWLMMMAGCVLLVAQRDSLRIRNEDSADRMTVQDVMLHTFTVLEASDTLAAARERTQHSLEPAFLVARGPLVVGAISREALYAALRVDGNGYVQGAMRRQLRPAAPEAPLLETLRSHTQFRGGPVIPVLRGEHLVGVVLAAQLGSSLRWPSRNELRGYARGERNQGQGRSDRNDRNDRSDRSDRNDRRDPNDRNDRQP